jgi:hypothetical protein
MATTVVAASIASISSSTSYAIANPQSLNQQSEAITKYGKLAIQPGNFLTMPRVWTLNRQGKEITQRE